MDLNVNDLWCYLTWCEKGWLQWLVCFHLLFTAQFRFFLLGFFDLEDIKNYISFYELIYLTEYQKLWYKLR